MRFYDVSLSRTCCLNLALADEAEAAATTLPSLTECGWSLTDEHLFSRRGEEAARLRRARRLARSAAAAAAAPGSAAADRELEEEQLALSTPPSASEEHPPPSLDATRYTFCSDPLLV